MKIYSRFSIKKSLILFFIFNLFFFAQYSFSQTIPSTAASANCQSCSPPGWSNIDGGTPDISSATRAAAEPTYGGGAYWVESPGSDSRITLPLPPNGDDHWMSLRDLGPNLLEESTSTTISGLTVGRDYEVIIYALTAVTDDTGDGYGFNTCYAGTYNDAFTFEVDTGIQTITLGAPNIWEVRKLRFKASGTSVPLIIRPGKNSAFTNSGRSQLKQAVQISVTGNAINELPVANDDSTTTLEDIPVTLNVTSNDVDGDGSIDVTTVDLDPSTPGIQNSLVTTEGRWTVDGVGNVTFTPVTGFLGTASVPYTVNDDHNIDNEDTAATTAPATVTVVVGFCEVDFNNVTTTPNTPTSCASGNDGSIVVTNTILKPNTAYIVTYKKDASTSVTTASPNPTTNANGDLTISNLEPGSYADITVVSIANAACSDVLGTFEVESFESTLGVSTNSITDLTCFGGNEAEIDLNVVGGKAPYIYSWTNGRTTRIISDIPAGNYTVTVTDANSCEVTKTFTVNGPTSTLETGATTLNESCNECNDGKLFATPTGGSGTYVSYVWDLVALESDGSSQAGIYNIPNVEDVPPGTYKVTVKDDFGCEATNSVVVNPYNCNTAVVIESITPTTVLCKGTSTGSAVAVITAADSSLTYQWTKTGGGTVGTNSAILSNVSAGIYTIKVTNSKGCFSERNVTINEPAKALIAKAETVIHQKTIDGTEGEVIANPTGGTSPYSYSWENANSSGTVIGITKTLSGLLPGNYVVTVTDANGCKSTSTTTINSVNCNVTITTSFSEILCNGGTASAQVNLAGGTGPYNYVWKDSNARIIRSELGVSNAFDINIELSAGEYTVTALDKQGCGATKTITITEPDKLELGASINPVACKGDATGSIELDVKGGTVGSGYTYVWTKNGSTIPDTTQDLNNIDAGTYEVTVTDSKNCTAKISRTITEPAAEVAVTISSKNNLVCFGDTSELTANASGGSGTPNDYTYSWTKSGSATVIGTEKTLKDLGVGAYTVIAKDLNGCDATATFNLTGSSAALDAGATSTNETCVNCKDGTLTANPTGGTAPYTYVWDLLYLASDGSSQNEISTQATVSSVAPGKYRVTVTDALGCEKIDDTIVVSVFGGSDVVTVKTNSATGFMPGTTVSYTITMTNNGPLDAPSVYVEDIAPVGTTISTWSAEVKSGTGTADIPNATGKGDLKETFTNMSNGAVVVYTVNVDVPSNFTDTLSNIANVDVPTDPNPECPQCTDGPDKNLGSDIETVKTNGKTSFSPGEIVPYTITMTNNGPNVAPSVTIKDTAPAGTTIKSWEAEVTKGSAIVLNTSGTGDLDQTFTNMSNGAVVVFTVNVDVPSTYTGTLTNEAKVTTPTDPNPDCPLCTDGPDANGGSDIETVKTNGLDGFMPGATVPYTITMTNNGPDAAPSVQVEDIAPVGTTISSWSAAVLPGTGTADIPNATGTGNINETIANMSNGTVVVYTVNVAVPADFTGDLSNTAKVTTPTDPNPECPQCTDGPDKNLGSDIETVKTNGTNVFAPGTTVPYTITMTNNGPAAAPSVQVEDLTPAGTTITSWEAKVTNGSATLPNLSGAGDVSETITDMSNGAIVVYTVNVAVPADFTGTLTNTAKVTTPTDPNPECPQCTDGPDMNGGSDIETVKTNGLDEFMPGTTVPYAITMTNNGPDAASSVQVEDIAPVGTTISSWSAAVISGTATIPNASGSGDLNETITDMSNGAVVVYTVNVAVPADFTGDLTNEAKVTTPTDPNPECPQCTDGPDKNLGSDIETVKTNGTNVFAPGTTVPYTITMTNNGPAAAPSVQVEDIAPVGTTISSWSAAVISGTATIPNASGSGDLNETITDMSNGAVVVYTVNVAVPADFTGDLTNEAKVTTPTDPNPECPQCTDGSDKNLGSDIETVKTNGTNVFAPGTTVPYTITMTNNGPAAAPSVQVEDLTPAGTTITSWEAKVTNGSATLPNLSGSGDVSETITDMSNGAIVVYTVNVAVPMDFTGSLTNTAKVTTPTDPNPECPQCTDGPDMNGGSDIETVKTNGATSVLPGTTVPYTITMTNNGPDAAPSVQVEDIAPVGTTISSWSAAVISGTATIPNASGSGDLNETITDMSNGAVVVYTVNVDVPTDFSGNLSNTAVVTTPTDPNPDCPQCTDGPDTLNASPSISLLKEGTIDDTNNDSNLGNVGDTINYVFTIENTGNVTLKNITVNDMLEDVVLTAGRPITLEPGEIDNTTFKASYVIKASDGENGSVGNQAEVRSDKPGGDINDPSDDITDLSDDPGNPADVDIDNDGDPDDKTVTSFDKFVDVSITKVVNNEMPKIGETVTFTITVSNIGLLSDTNLVVSENIPSGYDFVSAEPEVGTYTESTGIWNIPSIAVGQSVNLLIKATVLDFGDYLNTVSLSVPNGSVDIDPENNEAQADITTNCLTFYNEFSPNGDAYNQSFVITCIENYPDNNLEVYNQWGKLVYKKKGYKNEFDGVANVKSTFKETDALPVGTYYYILDLGDGTDAYTGWIHITR